MSLRIRPLWLLSTLLLASCSNSVPVNIRNAPADSLSLTAVREDPDRYQAQDVRWGGDILVIENRDPRSNNFGIGFDDLAVQNCRFKIHTRPYKKKDTSE